MIMKLKFFENKTNPLPFFTVIFFSLTLSGCSEFFGYQPPAPIYGERQVQPTNPYAEKVYDSNHPRQQIDTTVIETKTRQNTPVFSQQVKSIKSPASPPVIRKPQSPAVLALVSEADRNSRAGDLESAVVTIERALRIDGRNPALTFKLAQIRLKQSKPRLAEDLAKKAALLSANDRTLKKQSWLLISEARRQQKKYYSAKEAMQKANAL